MVTIISFQKKIHQNEEITEVKLQNGTHRIYSEITKRPFDIDRICLVAARNNNPLIDMPAHSGFPGQVSILSERQSEFRDTNGIYQLTHESLFGFTPEGFSSPIAFTQVINVIHYDNSKGGNECVIHTKID